MARGRSVRVEGLKELDAAFGELTKATAKGVARRVLLMAGAPIQKMAHDLAPERPVDAPEKTYKVSKTERRVRRPGTTKFLVQIGTRLTKRQAAAARKEGKSFTEVYVGTRDRVARLPEFGTARAPAHPFLRPAWDANKQGALKTIADQLGIEIDKAAKRAAKRAARPAAKARG